MMGMRVLDCRADDNKSDSSAFHLPKGFFDSVIGFSSKGWWCEQMLHTFAAVKRWNTLSMTFQALINIWKRKSLAMRNFTSFCWSPNSRETRSCMHSTFFKFRWEPSFFTRCFPPAELYGSYRMHNYLFLCLAKRLINQFFHASHSSPAQFPSTTMFTKQHQFCDCNYHTGRFLKRK